MESTISLVHRKNKSEWGTKQYRYGGRALVYDYNFVEQKQEGETPPQTISERDHRANKNQTIRKMSCP